MDNPAEEAGRISEPVPEAGFSPPGPGPGDLSRRIASRRTELRLSIQQVAVRAQMSPQFVDYLERYPARISTAGLRRLAAALETSSPVLLGAGSSAFPGRGRPVGSRALARLTKVECHRLIAPGGIGRVAFPTGRGPVVLPVNFAMVANIILFRTRPAGVIASYADDHPVTFEVDHFDEALEQGWSVLVQGTARRVAAPAELPASRKDIAVYPWVDGDRDAYIRIIPARISGRRVGQF